MAAILETLGAIDLFDGLSKKELKAVERILRPVTVSAGTEFITEGDVGRDAYVIVEGEATVWRRGRLITTVGPDTVIGEMAVLTGLMRTATLRAETDMELRALARRDFLALLDATPTMTRKLLVSTIGRLQELEPDLLG